MPDTNLLPANDPIPSPSGVDYPEMDANVDRRRLWHALLEKGWLVVLCPLVCLGLAVAYLRYAPVLYQATATLQVEQQERDIVVIANSQREDLRSLDILQTIAQSLKSRRTLERVAESNRLALEPFFLSVTNALGQVDPPRPAQLAAVLDRLIDVKLRRGTRLIDVSVRHRSPLWAARIANAVVQENLREMAAWRTSSISNVNTFLFSEAERLRKQLQQSELALQSYRETNGVTSLDERQNTVVARLKELSTKVTEAKSARIRAETDYAQVASFGTNVESLLTLAVIANNPSVLAARMSLTQGENDFAAVRQRYKEKHPKYLQMVSQLRELQDNLAGEVLKMVQTLKAGVESARAADEALEKALAEQEAAALALSRLAIRYDVLTREVESDRTLYESVLNRMKESDITKEAPPSAIRLVQAAFPPEAPVSPRKSMILALSILVGMGAGMLLVVGLNALDSSVKTVDEMEGILSLPVMAAIPHMKAVRAGREFVVVAEDSKSNGAEAFRSLRASLSMLGRIDDRRTFLFTSAVPGEGKTFCSVNFAASLAQLGLKTLLIDGDLRRPMVEDNLTGKDQESVGVTDYLTGQKKLEEVVQSSQVENLFFISGGTTAPNPAELLANTGLKGLLDEALQKYDRVVVDSAPIHAVSDTLLLVKNVQTVCLVVRAARTPRRAITRCVQGLVEARSPLAGVVMNQMPRRRSLGYGYYYDPYYDYAYQGKYAKKGVYGSK